MSDGAIVRPAAGDDVDELARLRWQLYAEDDPAVGESFADYRERFVRFATTALEDEDWRAWVAEEGGRIVGALWRHRTPRIPQPGRGDPAPLAYITNVYVEPAHRDAGVGARLLGIAVDASRAEGFSLAMVWPSDRSLPFYERRGFARLPDPLVLDLGGGWHYRGPQGAGDAELT